MEDLRRTRERLAEPTLARTVREDEDQLFDRSGMRVYLVDRTSQPDNPVAHLGMTAIMTYSSNLAVTIT